MSDLHTFSAYHFLPLYTVDYALWTLSVHQENTHLSVCQKPWVMKQNNCENAPVYPSLCLLKENSGWVPKISLPHPRFLSCQELDIFWTLSAEPRQNRKRQKEVGQRHLGWAGGQAEKIWDLRVAVVCDRIWWKKNNETLRSLHPVHKI